MSAEFRQRLLKGERLFGTMVTLTAPAASEVIANTGFDWLFIDGEHGLQHLVLDLDKLRGLHGGVLVRGGDRSDGMSSIHDLVAGHQLVRLVGDVG